jgi:hypothetical protein
MSGVLAPAVPGGVPVSAVPGGVPAAGGDEQGAGARDIGPIAGDGGTGRAAR